MSISSQTTWVNDYQAVDKDGITAARAVGIEVNDSAIPEWQSNAQFGWKKGGLGITYGLRYIDSVKEACANAITPDAPGCFGGVEYNTLGSTTYHDIQVAWSDAFMEGLKLTAGANNVWGKEPPVCLTCSLNGYDAGTYDLPGAFWYVSADFRF